jgi:hypothetical protein
MTSPVDDFAAPMSFGNAWSLNHQIQNAASHDSLSWQGGRYRALVGTW